MAIWYGDKMIFHFAGGGRMTRYAGSWRNKRANCSIAQ